MKIQYYRIIALMLLIIFTFVGCSEKGQASSESMPAISVDVPVDELEITEETESSTPEEPQAPPIPVHIGVERITLDKYSVTVVQGSKDMPIVTMHPTDATNKAEIWTSTYNPGVDPTANAALQELFAAAQADGLNLFVKSGFRSYSTQKSLYDKYVKRDGAAAADRYSARAGHSEHQTGLAFDINKAHSSFAGSPEAIWLAANCYKYGFIIRYPEGKEAITGYIYEPWHIRYLGVETATAVYNSGLCLEEYLGITSSYQN